MPTLTARREERVQLYYCLKFPAPKELKEILSAINKAAGMIEKPRIAIILIYINNDQKIAEEQIGNGFSKKEWDRIFRNITVTEEEIEVQISFIAQKKGHEPYEVLHDACNEIIKKR